MFDDEILKPRSMCKYTGLEKPIKHVFGKLVKIFKCKEAGKYRLIAYNALDEPVSGLIINPYNRVRTYQIDGVYTLKGFRRRGYARQLLAVARHTIGTVNHSDNLTVSGEAWRDSVERMN